MSDDPKASGTEATTEQSTPVRAIPLQEVDLEALRAREVKRLRDYANELNCDVVERKAKQHPTLCFLDTETTGLDPELHEVWEVGLIVRKWLSERTERRPRPGVDTRNASPWDETAWDVVPVPDGYVDTEYLWQLPVDLGRADPVALHISGFHERRWRKATALEETGRTTVDAGLWRDYKRSGRLATLEGFATNFARLTRGAHLVGNVVSFDEERLRKLLKANGALPEWHYHLIDVEALAIGYLMGLRFDHGGDIHRFDPTPPWSSDALMEALGIEGPTDEERHTALGDARWAMRVYDKVMG